jgi:hypothetical protein
LSIEGTVDRPDYYFTTRDLLLMAALAALGGITSTAINTLGDAVQSVIGFAGTTQWAAGLHVLWLTLAVGFTGKLGAGTVTGLLKGGVELLTGNTHGVLVVLGMLPFRKKDRLLPFCVAGGLASASNVFVFQLFASLPADVLAYGALLIISLVAAASGVLFAGGLGFVLLSSLQRSGVIKSRQPVHTPRAARLLFLALILPIVVGLTGYLRGRLQGPANIIVTGAVAQPFSFPDDLPHLDEVSRTVDRQGVDVEYAGYLLTDVLDFARPDANASKVLIMASDGYAFFLSMSEVEQNENILLSPQVVDGETSFNVVGPQSTKAWVRGAEKLVVVAETTLPLTGLLESPGSFDPAQWLGEMDSVSLQLPDGNVKMQGVPLAAVIQDCHPLANATKVVIESSDNDLTLVLSDVVEDEDLRIFSRIQEQGIQFVLGRMSGEVLLEGISGIDVR